MLRCLNLVQPVIRHAGFRARLRDCKSTIAATPAAAKGHGAGIGVADLDQVQGASIAAADIAAHEQRAIGLASP